MNEHRNEDELDGHIGQEEDDGRTELLDRLAEIRSSVWGKSYEDSQLLKEAKMLNPKKDTYQESGLHSVNFQTLNQKYGLGGKEVPFFTDPAAFARLTNHRAATFALAGLLALRDASLKVRKNILLLQAPVPSEALKLNTHTRVDTELKSDILSLRGRVAVYETVNASDDSVNSNDLKNKGDHLDPFLADAAGFAMTSQLPRWMLTNKGASSPNKGDGRKSTASFSLSQQKLTLQRIQHTDRLGNKSAQFSTVDLAVLFEGYYPIRVRKLDLTMSIPADSKKVNFVLDERKTQEGKSVVQTESQFHTSKRKSIANQQQNHIQDQTLLEVRRQTWFIGFKSVELSRRDPIFADEEHLALRKLFKGNSGAARQRLHKGVKVGDPVLEHSFGLSGPVQQHGCMGDLCHLYTPKSSRITLLSHINNKIVKPHKGEFFSTLEESNAFDNQINITTGHEIERQSTFASSWSPMRGGFDVGDGLIRLPAGPGGLGDEAFNQRNVKNAGGLGLRRQREYDQKSLAEMGNILKDEIDAQEQHLYKDGSTNIYRKLQNDLIDASQMQAESYSRRFMGHLHKTESGNNGVSSQKGGISADQDDSQSGVVLVAEADMRVPIALIRFLRVCPGLISTTVGLFGFETSVPLWSFVRLPSLESGSGFGEVDTSNSNENASMYKKSRRSSHIEKRMKDNPSKAGRIDKRFSTYSTFKDDKDENSKKISSPINHKTMPASHASRIPILQNLLSNHVVDSWWSPLLKKDSLPPPPIPVGLETNVFLESLMGGKPNSSGDNISGLRDEFVFESQKRLVPVCSRCFIAYEAVSLLLERQSVQVEKIPAHVIEEYYRTALLDFGLPLGGYRSSVVENSKGVKKTLEGAEIGTGEDATSALVRAARHQLAKLTKHVLTSSDSIKVELENLGIIDKNGNALASPALSNSISGSSNNAIPIEGRSLKMQAKKVISALNKITGANDNEQINNENKTKTRSDSNNKSGGESHNARQIDALIEAEAMRRIVAITESRKKTILRTRNNGHYELETDEGTSVQSPLNELKARQQHQDEAIRQYVNQEWTRQKSQYD